MKIEIEDVTPKRNNKIKIIVFIVLFIALCVLTLSALFIGKIDFSNRTENNDIAIEEKKEAETKEKEKIAKKQFHIITENEIDKINNIYKSEEKRVFLTFDDGPSRTITPQILEILDEYNIKATFFALGYRAELYPEILKEEYNKGHFIGNHGYSHKYSSIYESIDNIINEYRETEIAIRNAIEEENYVSNVFRFPGGSVGGVYNDIKKEAKVYLNENNIGYLDWNSLTRDSEGSFSKDELIQNMIDTVQNKNSLVILMHDTDGKQTTVDALPSIIEYLQNEGYAFYNLYDLYDEV